MEPRAPIDRIGLADQIFADALDLPEPERSGFVRDRCASDIELGQSVLKLLEQHGQIGSFLDAPAFEVDLSHREFRAGDTLAGRFKILEPVGRGGMGEVYRAEDRELGEAVALKTLRPRLRNDASVAARFRDEIRLARKIAHPNVCRIFDLFTETRNSGEIVFFTMEFIAGETLAARLAGSGPLPAEAALAFARQIAAGLDAAHRMGIVHRDLKPANILLAAGGGGLHRAIITDFGLAKAFDAAVSPSGQTLAGQIVGTPDYMAPEQFLGSEVTPAADIFALALIVYEMVAGRRPYPQENVVRSAIRRMMGSPELLLANAPYAPAHWSKILERALSAQPGLRPASAGELVKALEGRHGSFPPRLSRRALWFSGAGIGAVSSIFAILRFKEWDALPTRPLLMLTPLHNSLGTSRGSPTAHALDLLLARQLQQSSYVRLLSEDRVRTAWKRIAVDGAPGELDAVTARHIALREAAPFLLFGTLSRVGDEIRLELSLEMPHNDTAVPRRSWPKAVGVRQESDLPSAVFEVASWIRRTVGESASEVDSRSRRPEELTTSSWHALQEFALSEEQWRAGQSEAALLHLKTALDQDPQFALASARMADHLTALRRPDEAVPFYSAAAESIRRKNLTDRESLRIRGLFALDTGQFPEAELVFSRWALQYPSEGLPLFYKASSVERQGNPDAALHLTETALSLEAGNWVFLSAHASRLLDAGRVEEAAAENRRAAAVEPKNLTEQLWCAIAFAKLDMPAAWKSLETMRLAAAESFQSRAFGMQACLRAEQGKWAEAESLLHEGLAFDVRMNLGNQPAFTKRRLLAQLMLRRKRKAEAVAICREMLATKPGYEDTMLTGCLLAQAGEVGRAEACLIPGLPQLPVYQHWWLRLNGEIAAARGAHKRALQWMRQAPPARIYYQWPEHLVRESWSAGELDLVRDYLAKLFTYPGRYWFQADSNGPGFISWALDFAGTAGLPAAVMQRAETLRRALQAPI